MRRTSTTASLAIRAHIGGGIQHFCRRVRGGYGVAGVASQKNRLLNWLVVNKLLAPFHPIHTENILRVLYAEMSPRGHRERALRST